MARTISAHNKGGCRNCGADRVHGQGLCRSCYDRSRSGSLGGKIGAAVQEAEARTSVLLARGDVLGGGWTGGIFYRVRDEHWHVTPIDPAGCPDCRELDDDDEWLVAYAQVTRQ